MADRRIIELRDVGMVRENKTVLQDINLEVNEGDFIAITGPNGGGKTTLLRILLKLLRPTKGHVRYLRDGESVKNLDFGYLPQKTSIDSRFPISVRQVIASGLLASGGLKPEEKEAIVDSAIREVWLEEKAGSPIGDLSGGQLQRCLLGRAIIANPQVLVLDEPLSYIDRKFEDKVYELIAGFRGRSTVILVSHEMTRFAEMATRHLIVNRTLVHCHSASHLVHFDCCG